MYVDPQDKLRYCWRCRKRIGRGPGTQVCQYCKTYNSVHGLDKLHRRVDDLEERLIYYEARAEQELELFAESPWRRLPGAHERLLEAQTKLAGTTGRVAAAHQIE